MYSSEEEKAPEAEWKDIRGSLTNTDTETVADQLGVMEEAQVIYSDGKTSEWEEDLTENYRELVNAFGGEDNLEQYMDIGGLGVSVAVEEDDEPVFVVYGKEEINGGAGGINLGILGTYN